MTPIFHYTDYRAFLKDALQALKEKDPKISQRWIQQRLAVKTSGWLADLLAGRRKLGRPQLEAFSRLLNLSAREELYFQTLVDYVHAPTAPTRNRAFEKLASFHEVPRDLIDPDRFEYFSKWYYGAIREFLLIEPFRGDHAKLARSLRPPITPAQAKDAIAVLERLGMVKRFASGELRPSVEHVKKLPHFGPEHYYRYIRSQMELGIDAVERIPKDERDVSALTLVLSEEGFRIFRQELKELRSRMVQISESENKKFWTGVTGDSRRVYQSVLQVFPVSQHRPPRETP
ncbi:MAG: TIGR02147 family protein [Fibrobacteria bacterium]|nr:TIGR02147 family protein [Fibrobacteria bacterium]